MKKSFFLTSMAAFTALCFNLTAQAQGPVVVSDKDDYAPGETALFQAAGFQPNELLDFSVAVQDDQGLWVPDIAWADVPADASGGAVVDYVVPQTWANKSLQLTVMGLSSGLMATTMFTDTVTSAVINSPTTGTPVHVTTAGGNITANVSWTSSGGGDANIHFTVDATDTNQYNNQSQNGTNVNYTVTVPAGLAVGCHDLRLQVVNQGQLQTTQTCAIIVDAPASPTPIPSATPTATPCQNQAPVIMCLNNNADLGQVVGCLGVGTGFGQTFPVAYDVDGQDTTTATVKATFTKPDATTVTVDVASVTDPDGDTVHVDLSNGTNPVALSGPGLVATMFSVDIDADDGQDCNNTASNMCGGQASATIAYDFHGFFPPLSNTATTKVKQGSAVPVKFQIFDCSGTPITPNNIPGGMLPTINVTYLSGAAPAGLDIDDAGNSNGDTLYFRYDWTDMQWIFNNKTNSTYRVGCSYLLWAVLGDGVDHNAAISIK